MVALSRRIASDFAEVVARDDGDQKGVNTKMIVEYAFVTLAVLLGIYIVVRRIRGLKPANQTYWQFFVQIRHRQKGVHYIPRNPTFNRTPGTPNPDGGLAPLPSAYQGYSTRRTQAQDVDASGRRIGGNATELDHGGALDDKDILPAYDMHGGPPKYFEPLAVADADTLSTVESSSRAPVNEESTREAEDNVTRSRPPSPVPSHQGEGSSANSAPPPNPPSYPPAPATPPPAEPTTEGRTSSTTSAAPTTRPPS